MVKAAYFDENGMKKGAWSAEEDEKLRAYVLTYGHWNWRALPKFAGLSRCGKSCRLRWMNYLRPNLKRGKYTKEEEDLIIQLHQNLGNKWSAIAAKLPGRTDNEIKNHWHTHLKKRVEQNHSVASKRREQSVGMTLTHERSDRETNQKGEFASQNVAESAHPPILESYALSPEPSSLSKISDHVPSIANNWEPQDGLMANCFWSEPFLVDKSYGQSDFSTALGEGEFPSLFGSNFDDDSDFFHELLR